MDLGSYIGKPWSKGKCGPDSYDCFGLVRDVAEKKFNFSIPYINPEEIGGIRDIIRKIQNEDNWKDFEKVKDKKPQNGDLVRLFKNCGPLHIGIYIDGKVLHSHQYGGVCWDEFYIVKIKGWTSWEFWRKKNETR